MHDPCQVPGCGKPATYHAFPANAAHPDEGGMATCDAHLSEGMSHLPGQPAPEHWRVFPLHEGSPPYCAVTCPTCHPTSPVVHIDRDRLQVDPDRFVFGIMPSGVQAIPTSEATYTEYHRVPVPRGSGGFTVLPASNPAAPVTEVDLGALLKLGGPGEIVYNDCKISRSDADAMMTYLRANPPPPLQTVVLDPPVLIDGLTPGECRERWEANAAAIESGMATPYALSPDQIAEGKRLHLAARGAGR